MVRFKDIHNTLNLSPGSSSRINQNNEAVADGKASQTGCSKPTSHPTSNQERAVEPNTAKPPPVGNEEGEPTDGLTNKYPEFFFFSFYVFSGSLLWLVAKPACLKNGLTVQ